MTDATSPELASDRRPEARLAGHFVALADTLVADYDVVDLMDRLVHACVDLLDATAAGILLLDQRGGLQVVASSSEEARLLELFQLQSEEGPCLDCISSGTAVTVDELSAQSARWPRFVEGASLVGYRSVHALPLRLRDDVLGGLNLFRTSGPQLSAQEQSIAQALADVATVGILQQRSVHRAWLLAEQLQAALTSRIIIEQAKGVLAEHGQLSMDDAFRALRGYARGRNLKLSGVASDVVLGRVALEQLTPAGGRPALPGHHSP
jgi:transcriptional regulator with GAF, ATPase, and Fis domain